ncbi:uncharacterized protein [Halyomorpha halys]|uniref:uncharacterized protein n=1 Tax=Halyomorpha halys TaxID=286706 RepID=UPI0006D52556|nr:protein ALP1-like [Halyomorpha halys]
MATFTDQELMIIAIALDEEHEAEIKVNRGKRKWVCDAWKKRDIEGEFATLFKELVDDETKFFQYFRMSEGTFNLLLKKVEMHLKKQDTHLRKAIIPKERLAVCLRYLATGDTFQTISLSYRMGISTVYSIVMETCKVICENLMSTMLPRPTENVWKSIANDFYEMWNFPNCLGALDGKLITIQSLSNSVSSISNKKKTYSVALFGLVDAHHNFIAVDVGAYGQKSDGGTFASSNLFKAIEQNTLSIPRNAPLPNTSTEVPFVFVADEAFPLKTYLMRPYPQQSLDNSKRIYNYHLCQARKVVDDAFGILSQKFQIYNRKIRVAPHNVDYIILTTCILHNFIKKYDENSYNYEVYEDDEFPVGILEKLPILTDYVRMNAYNVREKYKDYLNSAIGSEL